MSKEQTNTETTTKTKTEPTKEQLAAAPDPAMEAAIADRAAKEIQAGLIGGPGADLLPAESIATQPAKTVESAATTPVVATATTIATTTTNPNLSMTGEVLKPKDPVAETTTIDPVDPVEASDTIVMDEFKDEIINSVKADLAAADEKKQRADRAWDNFYNVYPDLNDKRLAVDMARVQVLNELGTQANATSIADGQKLIAERTRQLIISLTNLDATSEVVNTNTTTSVVSSPGNPAPVQPVTKPAERQNMSQQMKTIFAPMRKIV